MKRIESNIVIQTMCLLRQIIYLYNKCFVKVEPFVIERIFEYPVSQEAKERMSFEERYEGFAVDLIKVI